MTNLIKALFGDEQGQMKQKIGVLYALLVAFNVGAWGWAFAAFHHFPLLMGTVCLHGRLVCVMRWTRIISPPSIM